MTPVPKMFSLKIPEIPKFAPKVPEHSGCAMWVPVCLWSALLSCVTWTPAWSMSVMRLFQGFWFAVCSFPRWMRWMPGTPLRETGHNLGGLCFVVGSF